MSEFTGSLKFVVFFLFLTLVVSMMFGGKVTMWFLTLILLGMMITNPDKITAFLDRFASPDQVPQVIFTPITNLERGGKTV